MARKRVSSVVTALGALGARVYVGCLLILALGGASLAQAGPVAGEPRSPATPKSEPKSAVKPAAPGKTSPKATAPKEASPKDPAPVAESKPDRLVFKNGNRTEGAIVDLTDTHVWIEVLGKVERHARSEIGAMVRGQSESNLAFYEKKHAEYLENGTAKTWKALAEFCSKKGLRPERRRALREYLRFDGANEAVHAELGHVLCEGHWIDEIERESKQGEGYRLVGGKLEKPEGGTPKKDSKETTAVAKKPVAEPPAYRILPRAKLTKSEMDKLKREREERLKYSAKFREKRESEYEGVSWAKRFEHKTAHFHVQSNASLELTRQYGALMELIRAELSKMFPSRIYRELRAPVSIYASQEDFMKALDLDPFFGRGLGGYYNPINQAIVTYHGTFGFTGTTFGVLCHEGTHYYQGLVLKNFRNVPIWLIEGLAVYFGDGSEFDSKKAKITVGKIPRDRLVHIQEKMKLKRHTPVAKLVLMERNGFSGSHYADSWALIYFLVNSGDKGKKLLTAYWAVGLERAIEKKDFKGLAEKYFGSIDELEKQYLEYISKLAMPTAGKVVGDYFLSEAFQFDYKTPGEEWEFFEDPADKKLIVGARLPGTSGEIRIYYENNLENEEPDRYFMEYLRLAKSRYSGVKDEKVKISNLDGYRVSYFDDGKGSLDMDLMSKLITDGDVDDIESAIVKRGPRQVVRYLLIQVDGVVAIECSRAKDETHDFDATFAGAADLFTLSLCRRW